MKNERNIINALADIVAERILDRNDLETEEKECCADGECSDDCDCSCQSDADDDAEPWEKQMELIIPVPQIHQPKDLAPYIDHTILDPKASREEIDQICGEAITHGFATVCVNSANIKFVAGRLTGSSVKPIAVVGFPFGAGLSDAKAFEAHTAIEHGAEEIDMVINIAQLKARNYGYVHHDIALVVDASAPHKVKVILETSELTDEEKVAACVIAKAAGAAFVKTSTGYSRGGATVEDVKLMKRTVGAGVEVKASGGIRSFDDALAMIQAGATRIGASKSVAIVQGAQATKEGY